MIGIMRREEGLQVVDQLEPSIRSETTTGKRWLLCSLVDPELDLSRLHWSMGVTRDLVDARRIVVIKSRNDAEFDLTNHFSVAKIDLGKCLNCLDSGEGKAIAGPQKSTALGMPGFAGHQEVNGDLVGSLAFICCDMFLLYLAKRIYNGVLAGHRILKNLQDDLRWQMRQAGGHGRAGAAGCSLVLLQKRVWTRP